MPGCTVPNCTNSSQKGFKLYRFPSDKERNLIWVQNCGRERGWKPTKHTCVCEVHFEDSQFESHRADGLRKLKPNAIPTIFSHAPHIRRYTRKPRNNDNAFMSSQCADIESSSIPEVELNMEEVDNKESDSVHLAEPEEVFINVSVASKFDNGPKTSGRKRKLWYNKRLERKEGIGENRKREESTSSLSARKMMKVSVELDEKVQTEEGMQDMSPCGTKDEEKQCFVCGKIVDKGLSLFTLTNTTKVHMYQKLDKIANGEVDLVLKEEGVLCSRCANLLNYMDRIEVELNMLKKAILTCIRNKCTMEFKSDNGPEGQVQDKLNNPTVQSKLEKSNVHCPNNNATPQEIQCHVCKFKSIYKSVMIFHLRQHLKDVYWCDFCKVPLPVDWIQKDDNSDEETVTGQIENSSNLPDVLVTVVPVTSEDTITCNIVDAVAYRNDSSLLNKDGETECSSRKTAKQIRVLNETGKIVVHEVSVSDISQEIKKTDEVTMELAMLGECDRSMGREESYQIVLTQESEYNTYSSEKKIER